MVGAAAYPMLATLQVRPCTPAARAQLEDESGPCLLQPSYAAAGMSKDGIQELLETYCDAEVQEYVDKHMKPRFQVWQPYCFFVLALLFSGSRGSERVQWLHQARSHSSQPAAVVSLPSLGTRLALPNTPAESAASHRSPRPHVAAVRLPAGCAVVAGLSGGVGSGGRLQAERCWRAAACTAAYKP